MNHIATFKDPSTIRNAILAGVVALLACLAFAGSLGGEFLYDDYPYVVENPQIYAEDWSECFSEPLAREPALGLYRPLTVLSYQLQASGEPPASPATSAPYSSRPFHILNVLLHAAVSVLLAFYLKRIGTPAAVAWLGAALFAVHPGHVEGVTWIVGRAELLAALFGLGFLHVMSRPGGPARTLAGALLWVLACLSKEGALVLPAALWLYEWLGQKPREESFFGFLRRCSGRYAFLAICLVGLIAVRVQVIGQFGPASHTSPFGDLSFLERVPVALNLAASYVGFSVVPFPTRIFYHHSEHLGLQWGSLAILAVSAVLLSLRRNDRRTLFLAAAALVALFPVLNLRPIGESFAERLLYLPSLFLCPLLADVLWAPVRAQRRKTGQWGLSLAIPAAVLAVFLGLTVRANSHFKDPLALWLHTASVAPEFPFPHYQVAYFSQNAEIYSSRGTEMAGAIREYQEALRLHDEWTRNGYTGMPIDQRARAHLKLGEMYAGMMGQQLVNLTLAERHLREAYRIALSIQQLDAELAESAWALASLRHWTPTVSEAEAQKLLKMASQLPLKNPVLRTAIADELELLDANPPR